MFSLIDMLNSMFSWNTTAMLLPQRLARDLADVDAVDGDAALVGHVETQDQVEERALARAARTDDRDRLADVELETEIVEHRLLRALILEGDALEGDVMGDARQVRRAGPVGAARRLVKQFLDVPDRRRRRNRHRKEMHDVGDVVGDLPERAFEGDEGADGDLALGREIRAERQHHQMQQQHGDRHRALHHGGEEHGGGVFVARLIVAQLEPAEGAAMQGESLDHRLRRDVLLHHAEQAGFVDLLLVIGLHRFRRENARADQRDRKHQQRHRGELPVQKQHQDDARDQLEKRQRGTPDGGPDRAFECRQVDRKSRQDFAALGALEKSRRQVLDVVEQPRAHIGDDAGRQPRVPLLIPDRDDGGADAGGREHAEDLVQRLEILFAERIVDQEFQAERHDDVEQRLHHEANADEGQHLLVIDEVRRDEIVDRRERAGGFLRGKDDEVFVLLVIEREFELVVLALLVIIRRQCRFVGTTAATALPETAVSSAPAAGLSSEMSGLGDIDPTVVTRPKSCGPPTSARYNGLECDCQSLNATAEINQAKS